MPSYGKLCYTTQIYNNILKYENIHTLKYSLTPFN